MASVYQLQNYTGILWQLNITDKEIDYVQNSNLSDLSHLDSGGQQNFSCYCSRELRNVARAYKAYHGYVALTVCIFGTIANLLNVVVLTHKDMAMKPINKILTCLAIADMLVMLEYIPFAIYVYVVLPQRQIFPYGWAAFVLFHMHFAQIFHTVSIALTLTLVVWRYIAIRFPQNNHAWCTSARCKVALWSCILVSFVACFPSFLVFVVRKRVVYKNGKREILYHVDADYSQEAGFLYPLNFWVLSIVIKLLPCVVLTVISYWLTIALYRTKSRKQALMSYSQGTSSPSCLTNETLQTRKVGKAKKRADRTTRMLLVVLLLFLVTEIPQGVLGLLSGILGDCFFRSCYHNFGEFMDILALLSCTINFILYCSMSNQFRTTFEQLFIPQIMKKWQRTATQRTNAQRTCSLPLRRRVRKE